VRVVLAVLGLACLYAVIWLALFALAQHA